MIDCMDVHNNQQSWAVGNQIVPSVSVLGTQKRVPSVLVLGTQKGSKVSVSVSVSVFSTKTRTSRIYEFLNKSLTSKLSFA